MTSPWWDKARHADRAPFLRARAAVLRAVRGWFEGQGFLEADVGALCVSPGAEVHTAALETEAGYLHTSPELAMKKLLAAGEERIFFLGKVYRAGEIGRLHAPEFTLLEWYRAGAPYEAVMRDCEAIVRAAAEAVGARVLRHREHACDPALPAEIVTVDEAFRRHTGAGAPPDPDGFAAALVSQVEPHLGQGRMTLLAEYPITEAALARPCPHDPGVAERFELYACGVELANGYGELTDPQVQRARLEEAMADKARRYGERWPIDEDFLAALADMAPASGVALGLDRLVMLATGARGIDDVLWTPAPRIRMQES